MQSQDPNLRWDGTEWRRWDGESWLRWNGAEWVVDTRPSASAGSYSYGYQGPVGYTPGYPAYVTDKQDKTTQAVVAWVLTVLTGCYFLPWAIAATRGKSDSGTIGWINGLLGWTLVGWVVALVMACTPHRILGPAPGAWQGYGSGYGYGNGYGYGYGGYSPPYAGWQNPSAYPTADPSYGGDAPTSWGGWDQPR